MIVSSEMHDTSHGNSFLHVCAHVLSCDLVSQSALVTCCSCLCVWYVVWMSPCSYSALLVCWSTESEHCRRQVPHTQARGPGESKFPAASTRGRNASAWRCQNARSLRCKGWKCAKKLRTSLQFASVSVSLLTTRHLSCTPLFCLTVLAQRLMIFSRLGVFSF
jgi:hypothetical protein